MDSRLRGNDKLNKNILDKHLMSLRVYNIEMLILRKVHEFLRTSKKKGGGII
jgi:hypothetical protein